MLNVVVKKRSKQCHKKTKNIYFLAVGCCFLIKPAMDVYNKIGFIIIPVIQLLFFFCVLLDATLFRLAFFFVLVVYTLKYNTQTYSNDHYFIYTFVSPQFDLIFWLKLCLLKNKAYFKADDYDYNENQTNDL